MNNNKDDKEKEPIKIDIENLEDMSEEDIINLINELSTKEPIQQKRSLLSRIGHGIVSFIKKFIIEFILVFTLNVFLNVIDTSFINLLIYFSIFCFIDFIFSTYFKKKFPLIFMISFGIINFIISVLSFIISGVICLQFLKLVFAEFVLCLLAIILFVIIKKFTMTYLLRLSMKGSKNVSNK